ncbi:FadR/GntR family transcriptional regulator [Bordetella genomosp. 9]|uniref:GntR family transcriptional regulator n=1 Tax=Bordetella genomosp. 9 TaxID=1416803 RepID=A0A1W6YW01_9BORD|nr:FadR/GntR family transcriptional regulator [Bordetella genomosp. 9]ARP85246.1 GntR family transcriptional regulator [Bordetella genomosp. 9]ARP89235.1 GntR family transcriptional regulator [Bordetella genomosp. 9]
MPFQAIEPRRLYRQIADQLRALIESGEFPVGTRLPPERDLALKMGVSRPSVREALIALEVEGLVEVRMGSGIYVRARGEDGQGSVIAESPLDTILARQLIEGELAAQAAQTMRARDVVGLREALDVMREEAASGNIPARGDRLFHVRIAQASDNSVLLRLVGELYDERHNPLAVQLGNYFENADSWAAAIAEHERVVDAIQAGDSNGARAAMREHLAKSHDRLTANWSPPRGDRRVLQ